MSEFVSLHGHVFTSHKSPLGWRFSAEEMARAWEVGQISEKWFNEHYTSQTSNHIVKSLDKYANGTEKYICKNYIKEIYNLSLSQLNVGVKMGMLHRHKVKYSKEYWYDTTEIENYVKYINNTK